MYLPVEDKDGNPTHIDFRLLEQRSRLEFNYPRAAADGGPVVMFVPFYENPIITESKSANYAEYDVLGRSSNLYAYTGAKSRKFKIDVHYTLHHLKEMAVSQSRFKKLLFETTKEAQDRFFLIGENVNDGVTGETQSQRLFREYSDIFAQVHGGNDVLQRFKEDPLLPTEMVKTLDTLLFFINVLRSSVYNNSTNPLHGPPLVRLNHGALYQRIPCIIKNYNISFVEEAGYHVETLMPNRIKVSLSLDEIRAGDFGSAEAATPISQDNLVGWESVLSPKKSLDPGAL
jgi:hypothetical protein